MATGYALQSGLHHHGPASSCSGLSLSLHPGHASPLSLPKTRVLAPATEPLHVWSPLPSLFFPNLLPNFFICVTTAFPSLPKIMLSTYLLFMVEFFVFPPPPSQPTRPAGIQAPFEHGSCLPCPSLSSHHLDTRLPGCQLAVS